MLTSYVNSNIVERNWYLIDCSNIVVGRLSSIIANLLMGKNKSIYSKHSDVGDFVILINLKDVIFTGNKEKKKKYWNHTGFIGSINFKTPKDFRIKDSTFLIKNSINGMLPKNKLRKKMMKRLKCYSENIHPYKNQKFIFFNYNKYLFK